MDMIRWLATNKVVLAVWGLGILAILLSAIFGGKKAEPEAVATETKVVEATVEETKPVAETVSAAATTTAGTATAAAASTVQAAVDTSAEATSEVAEEASKAVETATNATSEAEESSSSTEGEANDQSAAASASNLGDKSSDDLLMMAREAYWNNGLDEAANLYAELIAREPDTIEHKGELGNVFWRQGYPKKAAELYAEIAEPMIAQGNGERVSNMVGFISLFFPERAAGIRKLLDAQ